MGRYNDLKTKRLLFLILFVTFGTTLVYTEELDPQFIDFLDANPPQDHIACAYTQTHSSKDSGTRVERYSPETQWQLVTINGSQPSERELADYAKEAEERIRRRNDPADLDFLRRVADSTVRLERENDETLEFVFVPDMGGDIPDRMKQKMSGHLSVDKDGLRPMKFEISLSEPASPMRGVKVRKFEQKTLFVTDQQTGATLVKSMSFEVAGRAFLVTKIDQAERVEFSDFNCKVAAAQTPGT